MTCWLCLTAAAPGDTTHGLRYSPPAATGCQVLWAVGYLPGFFVPSAWVPSFHIPGTAAPNSFGKCAKPVVSGDAGF